MKVKRLQIRNYRSIVDADIVLDKINWFFGPNRSGKSTTLRALHDALMAKSGTTVVRHGTKSAELTVFIEANNKTYEVSYRRFASQTTTPRLNKTPIAHKDYIGAMEGNFGIDARVLDATLQARRFMQLKKEEQLGVILSAAGKKIDWAEAEQAFLKWCTEHQTTPFRLSDAMVPIKEVGVKLLDRIQQAAYDVRRDLNREIANAPTAPTRPPEALQYIRDDSLLSGIRREKAELRRRLTDLRATSKALEILSNFGDPDADLAEFPMKDLEEKSAIQKKKKKRLAEALEKLKPMEDRARYMLSARSSLESRQCPFGVRCNYRDDDANWNKLTNEQERMSEEAAKATANLPPAPDQAVEKELVDGRKKLIQIRGRIKERAKQIAQLGSSGGDSSRVKLELEMAEQRSEQLRALLKLVDDYFASLARHKLAMRAYEEKALRQQRLDCIVNAFTREVPSAIFGEVKDRFVAPFRKAMRLFFDDDTSIEVTATPNFSLHVVRGENRIAFSDLSESEQIVVGAAANHAVAQLGGTGLLSIDAVDVLQGPLRTRFVRGLYSLSKDYDTIVVASSIGDDVDVRKSPLKRLPGTRLFAVGHVHYRDESYGFEGCIEPL